MVDVMDETGISGMFKRMFEQIEPEFEQIEPSVGLLQQALRDGNSELVLRMITEWDIDFGEQNETGRTPLMTALLFDQDDAAQLLLAKGVGLDQVDDDGMPALFLAIYKEKSVLALEMIRMGAEPNIVLTGGIRAGKCSLELAYDKKMLSVFKALLEAGADPNLPCPCNGNSWRDARIIHYASKIGRRYEYLQLLLEHGAEHSLQKGDGWTPLHLASTNNNIENVKLLLRAGADMDMVNHDGRTFLEVAKNNLVLAAVLEFMKERVREITLENGSMKIKYGDLQQTSCYICFEDYVEDDELRILPCRHMCHARCVDRWLIEKGSCPTCNTPIGSDQ